MAQRFGTVSLVASAAVLALSACSTPGVAIVSVHADYPSYDTATLIDEASLIVAGTALASQSAVMEPWYEGEDPEENPLAGLSEEEKERAVAEVDGVAATAVTFRADVVYQGNVDPGQEITVIQTGVVIDGVTYQVDSETPLEVDESYLIFASHGRDDTFVILGGAAGVYLAAEDGAYTATAANGAPAERFTAAELSSLTE